MITGVLVTESWSGWGLRRDGDDDDEEDDGERWSTTSRTTCAGDFIDCMACSCEADRLLWPFRPFLGLVVEGVGCVADVDDGTSANGGGDGVGDGNAAGIASKVGKPDGPRCDKEGDEL
jgi:hypothetical protein